MFLLLFSEPVYQQPARASRSRRRQSRVTSRTIAVLLSSATSRPSCPPAVVSCPPTQLPAAIH